MDSDPGLRHGITALALFGILSFISATGALAEERRYVYWNVGTPGDGTTWANAYDTIQAALAEAAGDSNITEIWVAHGVYYPGGVSTDSYHLRNNLTLYGGFKANEAPTVLLECRDGTGACDDVGQICGTGRCADVRSGTCNNDPSTDCWFNADCGVGEMCNDAHTATLRGDLYQDDTFEPCTTDADCTSLGKVCTDQSFCIQKNIYGTNSFHVVQGWKVSSAVLDVCDI